MEKFGKKLDLKKRKGLHLYQGGKKQTYNIWLQIYVKLLTEMMSEISQLHKIFNDCRFSW
jgi:hypothetical protein